MIRFEMARQSELRKNGLDKIVAEHALTNSEQEIVEILAREHNFKASKSAVHRIVSPIRREAGERIKAKLNDRVEKDLPANLDELDHQLSVLKEIYDNPTVMPGTRIHAIDKGRAIIDTKLKYSGAGQASCQGQAEGIMIYLPCNGRDDGS